MEEKSFFQKLYEVLEGSIWSLRITATKGILTISLSPVIGKDVPPITMSGTPEDFEREFFAQLAQPLQAAAFTVQGITEMGDALKKIQQDKTKEGAKPAPQKPTATTGTTKKEEVKKDTILTPITSEHTENASTEEVSDEGEDPEEPEEEYPTDEVDVSPEPQGSIDFENF